MPAGNAFGYMGRMVGRSSGAVRNVASRARSTGGMAGAAITSYAAGHGGVIGKTVGAIAKRPKTSAGVAGLGLGYAGYRGVKSMRGSQNKPLQGFE